MSWLAHTWYFLVSGIAVVTAVVFWKWHDIHQRVGIWGYAGTLLGWLLIGLAVLGGLLPVIPGFPLGILGLLLLGPNDPLVRRIWLSFHHFARRRANSHFIRIRRLGHWLLERELRFARRVYKEGHVPPWSEEELSEKLELTRRSLSSCSPQAGRSDPSRGA